MFVRVFVWFSVAAIGLMAGGVVYEWLIVTPQWASNPPESVERWYQGAQLMGFDRVRFWIPVSLPQMLGVPVMLYLGWKQKHLRRVALLCGVCGAIVAVETFAIAIPAQSLTIDVGGVGVSNEDIVAATHQWVIGNLVRAAALFVSWGASLRLLELTSAQKFGK